VLRRTATSTTARPPKWRSAPAFWSRARTATTLLDRPARYAGNDVWSGRPTVHPDRWLAGGDRATVGQLELRRCATARHTPGHVVFASRDLGIAFVATLFQGSIGRTTFPAATTPR
jgi:glyoxylase-like metal-dependent hydrolase (beta-lactamase superfamily II)